ncbi:DNA-binding domain-containing protein [Luteolibacter sp. LG18]|uniref:DNA-binding domain-containing protein n=1 Tax=Luteolibacter sp. LG18 TaxID=2819286 RepID=UPI002B2F9E9A|nr:hypothetical protein llg_18920 [Luteolibacter sp. LG18]
MSRLEHLQREFFASLQFPLRGPSRTLTDLPPTDAPHAGEFLAIADEIIKPGPQLSSGERLELYHRQYWYRLLDSIGEDFPILIRMLGQERFWSLIEDYLLVRPSRSFTLRHLGEGLPGFVADWDKATEAERPWLYAIARMEYAHMEVFERGECRPVLPEELATCVLVLQPHVVRLSLPVPADLCVEWESFTPLPLEPVELAVWRSAHSQPAQARLHPIEAILLDRLAAGGTLGEIFEQPVEPAPTAEQVSEWFGAWHQRGWIAVKPATEEVVPFVRALDESGDLGEGVDKMGSQSRAME